MRFVVFADVHVDEYSTFAKVLPNGRNSRLANCINGLEQVLNYCIQNKIQCAVCVGDLFNKRDKISIKVYNEVYNVVEKFRNQNITLILVAGNHDEAVKDGSITSVQPLRGLAYVIDEKTQTKSLQFEEGKVLFHCIPFTEDVEKLKQSAYQLANQRRQGINILFAHCGVRGSVVGDHEYIPKSEIGVEHLYYSSFDSVFLGHYHKRQQVLNTNVYYSGSLVPWRFGESDISGFYDVHADALPVQISFVPIKCPRFVTCDITNNILISEQLVTGNYVKVIIDNAINVEEIKKELEDLKVEGYCIEFKPKEIKKETRINVGIDTGLPTMLERYVDSSGSELDKKRLINLGQELTK